MVDRNKLYARLMATFVDEVGEHVESLNVGVLGLESGTDPAQREESLARLFRAAHSLKGAARAVDVLPIERVCHHLEDVFTALRERRIEPTANTASLILAVADSVASAGELLRERQPVPDSHFDRLPARLQDLATGRVSEDRPDEDRPDEDRPDEDLPVEDPPDKGIADAAARSPHSHQPPESADDPAKDAPHIQMGSLHPAKAADNASPAAATDRRSLGATVRVAESKLDSLMAQAGELLVARQRLEIRPGELESLTELAASCRTEFQSVERPLLNLIESGGHDPLLRRSRRLSGKMGHIVEQTGEKLRKLEKMLEQLHRRLLADARQLNHVGEVLQQDIHRTRMLPFSEGCGGLERAVRDVAQATGKDVGFVIEGGDIEIDRTVLAGLRDPLLHLIRNAVDHGLEPPPERTAAGKHQQGEVRLAATLHGAQVDITVSDDGRGLNREAILKKRRDHNLPDPRDDHELFRSILLPGFSTATLITDLSGRGIGMDVVKSQLESLHGTIDLSSQPGLGTRFSLSVPLTLTTISALFARTDRQVFAIPSTNVSRLLRFRPDEVRTMGGQNVLSTGGAPVPVIPLSTALGMPQSAPLVRHDHLTGVVLTTGDRELIVVVQELIGERDAIVKHLGCQIRRVRFVSGATLQSDGTVALLLNAAAVVRASSCSPAEVFAARAEPAVPQAVARRILVVDDSMTTRSLLKNILEAAGYDVTAAVDGQEAWMRLQNSDIELVVTDVDMPRMDGFALTNRIRQSGRFQQMPVILVTSRDTETDKARGVEVGADAYLVKSSFHQSNVLDAIEQLL